MTIQHNLCSVCVHIFVGEFKMSTHLVSHSILELAEVLFDEVKKSAR